MFSIKGVGVLRLLCTWCYSFFVVDQKQLTANSVVVPGEGTAPLLLLDDSEAQRAGKIVLEDRPPPSKGLDDWAPPLPQGLEPALKLPI